MVLGVRSIRVFSQFLLDPYYEPLPWFMISRINNYKTSVRTIGSLVKASACRIDKQGSIPRKFKFFPACVHFLLCLKFRDWSG